LDGPVFQAIAFVRENCIVFFTLTTLTGKLEFSGRCARAAATVIHKTETVIAVALNLFARPTMRGVTISLALPAATCVQQEVCVTLGGRAVARSLATVALCAITILDIDRVAQAMRQANHKTGNATQHEEENNADGCDLHLRQRRSLCRWHRNKESRIHSTLVVFGLPAFVLKTSRCGQRGAPPSWQKQRV
jgi:hypothetical protein